MFKEKSARLQFKLGQAVMVMLGSGPAVARVAALNATKMDLTRVREYMVSLGCKKWVRILELGYLDEEADNISKPERSGLGAYIGNIRDYLTRKRKHTS